MTSPNKTKQASAKEIHGQDPGPATSILREYIWPMLSIGEWGVEWAVGTTSISLEEEMATYSMKRKEWFKNKIIAEVFFKVFLTQSKNGEKN